MVIDPETEEILLLETKPSERVRDPQEYPGGHAEENESDLQTGYREVKEETGLEVTLLTEPILVINPTIKVYLGLAKSREVVLTEQHKSFGWFLRPEDVPLPPNRELPSSYKGQFPPKSMYEEFRLAQAALAAYKASMMS
ncbi:NUDIX domain-containing protein [Shimazuella sp. KC615]|uniref:NUDIX domain-containing protein n=2 Tax=Shimazuella alba TaxID=2690964 RepID=A0A6I4VN86_9BACL|nr:NUDIX domain-containing protein [Shimazuella alba]